MNNEQPARQQFKLRDASWLTIGLAILTVITFFAVSGSSVRYGFKNDIYYSPTAGAPSAEIMMNPLGSDSGRSSAPSQGMTSPDYYPYPSPEVPATDTREFLKVRYNAQMRTRDVPGLTRRVETTVRGYDGRVDQQSSSDKYGSVTFAVPQSKFDAFRTELEGLVGSRYLRLSISSQNLLSQKVSIEEQEKQVSTRVAEYKVARQSFISAHTIAVQSLQAKIDTAQHSSRHCAHRRQCLQ